MTKKKLDLNWDDSGEHVFGWNAARKAGVVVFFTNTAKSNRRHDYTGSLLRLSDVKDGKKPKVAYRLPEQGEERVDRTVTRQR